MDAVYNSRDAQQLEIMMYIRLQQPARILAGWICLGSLGVDVNRQLLCSNLSSCWSQESRSFLGGNFEKILFVGGDRDIM
jgi:hypothetical protein